MADLAGTRFFEQYPRSGVVTGVVANTVQLYGGSLVGTNAAGFITKMADTAGHKFLGICKYPVLGATGSTPAPEAIVDVSGVTVKLTGLSGFAQADVNTLVYCGTDNLADITLTAATNVEAIGYVSRFNSATSIELTLFTPDEHLALNA